MTSYRVAVSVFTVVFGFVMFGFVVLGFAVLGFVMFRFSRLGILAPRRRGETSRRGVAPRRRGGESRRGVAA